MPPKLGCNYGCGRLYWKYSEKDPKWKVLKTYSSDDGITFECKLTKEEKKMPKFEAGDIVTVVKLDYNWSKWTPELSNYIGKTGVIVVNCCDYVGIEFGDEMRRWYFHKDWLELVEKAKKDCNGQVFIVDADYSVELETGKVYNVKDGYLMTEKGYHYNSLPFHSMKELLTWLAGPNRPNIQAIEFKGFAGKE